MTKINIKNKWGKVCVHAILWLTVFALPYLLYKSNDRLPQEITNTEKINFFYIDFCTNVIWVLLFYFTAYVLISKLVYKRKLVAFALYVVLFFVIVWLIHFIIFKIIIYNSVFSFIHSIRFILAPYLLTIASATVWRMWSDKMQADQLALQKQGENLKSELLFLRSQISPHFIFNILNNIVALVRLKSDELEPTIMKLSGLMQYMLYETDEEKVSLKTEAEYLQSYISLQQQRFGKKVQVNTQIELEYNDLEIEPMLLIPFVENAFKHGVGIIEKPEINIKLTTNANELHFVVSNAYNDSIVEMRDKTSGIGLSNVQRRLNLLYGNQQVLTIQKNRTHFNVSLTIKLH